MDFPGPWYWQWKWKCYAITSGLGLKWLFIVSTSSLNDFSFSTTGARKFHSNVYILPSNALNSPAACLPSETVMASRNSWTLSTNMVQVFICGLNCGKCLIVAINWYGCTMGPPSKIQGCTMDPTSKVHGRSTDPPSTTRCVSNEDPTFITNVVTSLLPQYKRVSATDFEL